jgi:ornithine carbamoyltransferase
MPTASEPRHFLRLPDLPREELLEVLALARRLEEGEAHARPLEGRTIALIFRKPSTRTRVSFEVAVHQLGGHPSFLSHRDTQIDRGEPTADTARVLSSYVDGIVIRTFRQEEVEELARHGRIPVINALTDLLHPCQLLADLMTLQQEFGAELGGLRVAWVGDGNNMANSWLNAAVLLGFELRLAVPEGYDPDPVILARARELARVLLTRDPEEAVSGAHAVNTDVWASMGQEEEAEGREAVFRPFQVNEALMAHADSRGILLHCLPAHRGEEVTAAVLDGPRSRVFRQARNRLPTQKALLLHLFAR